MPHRATGTLAGALLLLLSVAPIAHARGHDPGLPQPISIEELAQWFGPLLCEPRSAWPEVLEAHRRYLELDLRFRADEVDPRTIQWRVAEESPSRARDRERQRSRWLARIEGHDQQLFDVIMAAARPEAAPVVEWMRTRRKIETCECGLEVQTQEVQFSLLSYSDLAIEGMPLVWSSPQAAIPLNTYDSRILALGRRYLKAHRAWSDARAAREDDGREPAGATMPEQDDPEELQELLAERNALAESLGGEDQEDRWEPEDEGAATWRGHGRALAWMGRRMQTQIEAALDARARLLFRVRILQASGDLSGGEVDAPAGDQEFRSRRRAQHTSGPGSLEAALTAMRGTLERSLDPMLAGTMDIEALDAIASAHWTQALSHADEIVKASRRRGDARFSGQETASEQEQARWEARRLAAVRQWAPVAVEAAAAMSAIEGQALAMTSAAEAAAGPSEDQWVMHDGAQEEDESPEEDEARGLGRDAREAAALEPPDDQGDFNEVGMRELLHPVVGGPLTSERTLRAMGWSSPAQAQIVAALRADALTGVWGELRGILDRVRVLRESELGRPDADEVMAILLRSRELLGGAEERLLDQLDSLLASPEEGTRLELLRHSARFSRAQWPLDHAPGLTTPLVRPVDLAGALLEVINGAAPRGAVAGAGGRPDVGSEPDPAPNAGAEPGPGLRLEWMPIAERLLSRREELSSATQWTASIFAETARAALASASDADAGSDSRNAALRTGLADALLSELRVQREVLEAVLAGAPTDLAAGLRQRVRRAAVSGDIEAWLRDAARRPVRAGRADDAGDDFLQRTVGLIVDERVRQVDALVDAAVEIVLEHGTAFPDDWATMPVSQRRLEQGMRRLRLAHREIYARSLVSLAAVLPASAPAAAECGVFRLIGWCLEPERQVLAQVMGVQRLDPAPADGQPPAPSDAAR
jgi:hypothetical protein